MSKQYVFLAKFKTIRMTLYHNLVGLGLTNTNQGKFIFHCLLNDRKTKIPALRYLDTDSLPNISFFLLFFYCSFSFIFIPFVAVALHYLSYCIIHVYAFFFSV